MLTPLPVFRSITQTEGFIDSVAAQAGFTARAASQWLTPNQVRQLTYLNPKKPLELTVRIRSGGVLENAPVWVARAFLKRTDSGFSTATKARCRPSYFAKDVMDLAARLNLRRG